MTEPSSSLGELTGRSRTIFARLVQTYLDTGEPVGSRTLSKMQDLDLSAASIRNVMQDLEQLGLLDSPHISAGRVPTQMGLRMFVDGVLEIGDISAEERAQIERSVEMDSDMPAVLDQAGAPVPNVKVIINDDFATALQEFAAVITCARLESVSQAERHRELLDSLLTVA